MPRRLLLAWVAGACLFAGCAWRAPRALRPATAGMLLETLAARRAAVTSLRARARVRAGLSGLWVREALLVGRPAAIRIDVLSPFGLALAVGVQSGLVWAYPRGEGTRYEGQATPANLARFLGAPLAVADIVDVLLGVPPAREPAERPTLDTRDGEYRLTLPLADGAQTIWFAGDTLLVRRAEEVRTGGLVLRIAFDDYQDGFPHLLDLVAANGAAARLTYEQVEPNAPLDPAVFMPPPARRVLPLEAAPAPEPG